MSKIITITGNGCSGKTVFAHLLAKKLCGYGEKVVIVSTDDEAPSAQISFAELNKEANKKSLGMLLSSAIIDARNVMSHIQFGKQANLGLLAYALGETADTYPEITGQDMTTLFNVLSEIGINTVIVDTKTGRNPIDRYALSICDEEICITTADYRGLAYRRANGDKPNATHIMFEYSGFCPTTDILRTFVRPVKLVMPYIKAFDTLYNGSFLEELEVPKKGAYNKALDFVIDKLDGETKVTDDEQ